MDVLSAPFVQLRERLEAFPRVELASLPTPLDQMPRLTERLGGAELWVKRDDLTGLAGGGNKTRKLEFIVADAIAEGADTLVTVGAVQSNHARQTAAAAARVGLACELLLRNWVSPPGSVHERAGNALLNRLLGANIHLDATPTTVGDELGLDRLVDELRREGRRPYKIPGGLQTIDWAGSATSSARSSCSSSSPSATSRSTRSSIAREAAARWRD